MNLTKLLKNCMIPMVAVASMGLASADTIIYQEDFSGTNGTPLNGVTPTVTTGGATWTATSLVEADGIFTGAGANEHGILAFTPENGNVYTLSANLSIFSDQGLLLFFGNAGTDTFAGSANNNSPSMRVDSNGGTMKVSYQDPNADGEWTSAGFFALGSLLTITLDTTGVTTWNSTFSINGTEVGTLNDFTPGSIDSVGFSTRWFAGPSVAVDNFSLSVASVPEPSAWGLVGVACIGLLIFRRRQLKAAQS